MIGSVNVSVKYQCLYALLPYMYTKGHIGPVCIFFWVVECPCTIPQSGASSGVGPSTNLFSAIMKVCQIIEYFISTSDHMFIIVSNSVLQEAILERSLNLKYVTWL